MLSFNSGTFNLVKGQSHEKEALAKASNPQAWKMNFKAHSSTKAERSIS